MSGIKHNFAGKQYNITLWEPGTPVLKCTAPLCGIDSETYLIENKFTWPKVVVAGFASGNEVQIVQWNHLDEYQKTFVEINPTTKFVFFNNAFDINVMGRDLWLKEMERDNRIMELSISYKLYLAGTQGWLPRRITLFDVAKRLLGVELNKEDGTRTSFTRETPLTQQQIVYLAEDCIATELCGYCVNNMPTESLQARASFVLSETSHNGLLVDREHVDKMRAKLIEEMAELAKKLRGFGFRIKKDTESLTQLQRVAKVCSDFGIHGVAEHTAASGKTQYPAAALWVLTANLLSLLSSDPNALPSDISEVIECAVKPVFDPAVDWSAKNKMATSFKTSALNTLKLYLDKLECGDCIPDKSPKVEVALTILEILNDKFHNGELQATGFQAFIDEFQQCYDENLGWLAGTKPKKNSDFIQEHLIKLMAANPGLEFPLTDTSTEKTKQYLVTCRRKGVVPDAEELRKLAVYACKRAEMWRLRDLGITDPFLEAYTSYKHCEKLLSTYFDTKHIAEDGRVHTYYSDFLVTGRTASSGPWGPLF